MLTIILSALLALSEILGLSDCQHNGIIHWVVCILKVIQTGRSCIHDETLEKEEEKKEHKPDIIDKVIGVLEKIEEKEEEKDN